MRRALIAGNWKMHTSLTEARQLATAIATACRDIDDRDVMLAPPYTALTTVAEVLADSPVLLAAQNVAWEEKGAFTGEISPVMLREIGCELVIIGHSERRHIFHEDNAMINRRLAGALRFGLTPVLCVGETLEEREQGRTMAVLEEQIRTGLADIPAGSSLVIAYEPVWAIGTGKTASTAQAQEAHGFIRNLLADMYGRQTADTIRILYGGSVKPDNVDDLMAQDDIDGALVGGAALQADSFIRIIRFGPFS